MSQHQGFCPNCGRMHDLDGSSLAIPICVRPVQHCLLCGVPGHQSRFCADYTRIITSGRAEQVDHWGLPSGRTSSRNQQTHLADVMSRPYSTSDDHHSAMLKPKASKSGVSLHHSIKQGPGIRVESNVQITGDCGGSRDEISIGKGSKIIINGRTNKVLSKLFALDGTGMLSASSARFVDETHTNSKFRAFYTSGMPSATFRSGEKLSTKLENIGTDTAGMPSASDVRFVGEIPTNSIPHAFGAWAAPSTRFGEEISTNSVPHANGDDGWGPDGEEFSEHSKYLGLDNCPSATWGFGNQTANNSKSGGAEMEGMASAGVWRFGNQATNNSKFGGAEMEGMASAGAWSFGNQASNSPRSRGDLDDNLSPSIFGTGRFIPGFGEANANTNVNDTGSTILCGANDIFATTNANATANNLGPDDFVHLSPPNQGFSHLNWNTNDNDLGVDSFIHLSPPSQLFSPAHDRIKNATNNLGYQGFSSDHTPHQHMFKKANNNSAYEGFSFDCMPHLPSNFDPLKEPLSCFHIHEGTRDPHSAAKYENWTTPEPLSSTEKGYKRPIGTAQAQGVEAESTTAAQSSDVFAIECLCGRAFIADNNFITHARDCTKIRDRENHLVLRVNPNFSFSAAPLPTASNPSPPHQSRESYEERRLRQARERRQRWKEAQEKFKRKDEERMERVERRAKERQERFWEKQQIASEQAVSEQQERLLRQQEAEQTILRSSLSGLLNAMDSLDYQARS